MTDTRLESLVQSAFDEFVRGADYLDAANELGRRFGVGDLFEHHHRTGITNLDHSRAIIMLVQKLDPTIL